MSKNKNTGFGKNYEAFKKIRFPKAPPTKIIPGKRKEDEFDMENEYEDNN